MRNLLLIHRQRTEHARMVRRMTGTNLFTDKDVLFVGGGYHPLHRHNTDY